MYSYILYDEVIKFYSSAKAAKERPIKGTKSVITLIAYVRTVADILLYKQTITMITVILINIVIISNLSIIQLFVITKQNVALAPFSKLIKKSYLIKSNLLWALIIIKPLILVIIVLMVGLLI